MWQHNIWCVCVHSLWRGMLDCSPAYLSTKKFLSSYRRNLQKLWQTSVCKCSLWVEECDAGPPVCEVQVSTAVGGKQSLGMLGSWIATTQQLSCWVSLLKLVSVANENSFDLSPGSIHHIFRHWNPLVYKQNSAVGNKVKWEIPVTLVTCML